MIGIAGGAGPTAGIDLFRKIIEETKASRDQEHLPVVLWSVPELIPDRTEYLEGAVAENPAISISRVFLKLEKTGATVAAIPCNTAHAPAIFDKIRTVLNEKGSKIHLLSIISETISYLNEKYPAGTTVGVLSTTGTWHHEIYRKPLEEAGFRVLDSKNASEQQVIHDAVYNREYGIKAQSSPITQRAKTVLLGAVQELIQRGAQIVILGCTEIPLAITEKFVKEIELIDPTRILARALIRSFSPEKLKD